MSVAKIIAEVSRQLVILTVRLVEAGKQCLVIHQQLAYYAGTFGQH
jgi:hypothetical protein